jgi:hypothetical protein
MRGNEIDLKTRVLRHLALTLEFGEFVVRRLCDIRVKKIFERGVLRRLARLEPLTNARCAAGVNAEQLIGLFQGQIFGERGLEPSNPIAPVAGFAVGDAFETIAERGAHGRKHIARTGERYTADKMNMAHGYPPEL